MSLPRSRLAFTAATLFVSSLVNALPSPQTDSASLVAQGCYSSSTGLKDQGAYTYQSSGYCQTKCSGLNQAVMGLSGGSDCWCGNELPPTSAKVDDSKCSISCDGYPDDNCGGNGYYNIYLTGISDDVPTASGSSDSSDSGSSSDSDSSSSGSSASSENASPTPASAGTATTQGPPSVVTSITPGKTIVVTQPAAAENTAIITTTPTPSNEDNKKKDNGPNVAGIAAGVVIGVLVLAAIIGGLFFFFRNKRRQEQEQEEYKRNQVSDFMAGGNNGSREPKHPPGTAGGWSTLSDSRMDPEAGRRNSNGSIADDQDYSRRILRVANPS